VVSTSPKTVAIIGAGVAGLATGIYAQMNGYAAHVFEMHTQPGGLCTSWERKGYTIDCCVHWLTGSRPGTSLYKLWEEVGLIQGLDLIDHDELVRVEFADGPTVHLYTDLDRLEKHLLELAPEDAAVIKEFTGDGLPHYAPHHARHAPHHASGAQVGQDDHRAVCGAHQEPVCAAGSS
jgi:phytoene dehydrogenase-like protein